MGRLKNMIRCGVAVAALSIGLGVASGARAFQVPEAQNNQQNRLLHRVTSLYPFAASFVTGDTFLVTVYSDFPGKVMGQERMVAEKKIADKVYDFLEEISAGNAQKPKLLRSYYIRMPIDMLPLGEQGDFQNIRMYVKVFKSNPHDGCSLQISFDLLSISLRPYEGKAMIYEEHWSGWPSQDGKFYYVDAKSCDAAYEKLTEKQSHEILKDYFYGLIQLQKKNSGK